MEDRDRLFGTERKSSGKPVILYDENKGTFTQVEGPRGKLSIPYLPNPSDPKKTVLLQSGEDDFYQPIDPFEHAQGTLSKRVLEGKFRQETGLANQEDAIIVTRIPYWKASRSTYETKTPEQIRKERDDLARGIT